MLGTPKVSGLNLSETCFFLTVNVSVPKKIWPIILLVMFLRLSCVEISIKTNEAFHQLSLKNEEISGFYNYVSMGAAEKVHQYVNTRKAD